MTDWIQDLFGSTKTKPHKPPSHSQQMRAVEALSVNETDDHTIAKFDLGKLTGTIGMSHDGEDFYGFETWNGQKPVFILNEQGSVLGLESGSEENLQGMARAAAPRGKSK